ncbi:hypothetical protein DQY68_25845 [Salmonella enterica subsp. salamae]|nr:hypothetical protein [Salmonella enterica subsp. salamae]
MNFYQIISLHGKTTVTVRQSRANTQHTKSMMTGYEIPRLNDFCGELLKRRVREFSCEPAICIEAFETTYKIQPEEEFEFTSYY